MYLYDLVLMTLTFILVFLYLFLYHPWHVFMKMCLASCICKICLKLYDIHPWVTNFICHVLLLDSIHVWDKYVCFSFDKTYICLEVWLVFNENRIFHVLRFHIYEKKKGFHIVLMKLSFITLSPCICWLRDSCVLYILCLLMILVSWAHMCFIILWVSIFV